MALARGSTEDARENPDLVCQTICHDTRRQGHLPSFHAIAKEILRRLDQQIDNPTPACSGHDDHETLGSERLTDIRTRFLLWTGNLGVMHKPEDPRGLEKRLLDAPEVANRVREILGDLQDLLSQSGNPCECNTPSTPHETPIEEEEAMMMQLLGLQTSEGCITSWLSASLDDALRRLFHLSSLITKSSTRDKFVRAELKCRLEMYERFDIQHVREKVICAGGQANESLVRRLGKANTSRRQFLAYANEHYTELSRTHQEENTTMDRDRTDNEQNGLSDNRSSGRSALPSEMTRQSAAPTKASTLGLVDPNAFDYGLDDARSCTTVATSIVDEQAFSGLRMPELAHYAKPGEHFLCPLCRTVQRFNGQTAWRRHAFSDIRAYICTSKKCGMLMFGSFNTWRSHEMDHRREWICYLCGIPCRNRGGAREHIIQHHGDVTGDQQLDMLLQTSSCPPEHISASDCPLCDWSTILQKRNAASEGHDLVVPSRRFMKHLGRHLEELALHVVPQPDEDDDDDKTPGNAGSNAAHATKDDDNDSLSTLSSFRSNASAPDDAYANSALRASDPVPTIDDPGTTRSPRRGQVNMVPEIGTMDNDVLGGFDFDSFFAPSPVEPSISDVIQDRDPITSSDQSAERQVLDGSSHDYKQYKQQVGFPPGSLHNTSGQKESFNCPVNACKRHTGKGLSRMSGLVKHLAAVHGIKKTPSEIRSGRETNSSSLGRAMQTPVSTISSPSIPSARRDRSTRGSISHPKSATPQSRSSEEMSEPPLRSKRAETELLNAAQGADEEAAEDEEEVIRCLCGQQEYPGPPLSEAYSASEAQADDAGGLFIQCDGCSVWQHGGCVSIFDEAQSPDKYYCEECRPRWHEVHVDTRGHIYSRFLLASPRTLPGAHFSKRKRRTNAGLTRSIMAVSYKSTSKEV